MRVALCLVTILILSGCGAEAKPYVYPVDTVVVVMKNGVRHVFVDARIEGIDANKTRQQPVVLQVVGRRPNDDSARPMVWPTHLVFQAPATNVLYIKTLLGRQP